MKKYYIPTNEKNRPQVLNALEVAGFIVEKLKVTRVAGGDACVLVSHYADYVCNLDLSFSLQNRDSMELLEASWVIAHAHELDGAKPLCECPPKGFKLVTEEQRKFPIPAGITYSYLGTKHTSWNTVVSGFIDSCYRFSWYYAVPEDYVFPEPDKEIMIYGKPFSESTISNALKQYCGA